MAELMPKVENFFEFLSVHREMIQDDVRINAYYDAIKKTVKHGDVVVDVGTGTGILAFWCLQAGASKVYAIEKTDIIKIAQENAKNNNFSENIEFIHADSRHVELKEKADVVVSEVIGHFALEENMLDSIIDARERFLKNSGKLIPKTVDVFFVPVESPNIYEKEIKFWKDSIKGLNFSPAVRLAVNNVYLENIKENQFLSEPTNAGRIDLVKSRIVNLQLNCQFQIKKGGTLFGLGGWFHANLSDDIIINTSPMSKPTHWQQCFFPIQEPIEVFYNDKIRVEFDSKSLGDDVVWNWKINIIRNNVIYKSFRHSTSALVNESVLKHFWQMSKRSNKPKRISEILIS